MQRHALRLLMASDDIDEALRQDMVGQGTALPLVSLASDEHGPLIVMRAVDMAVVLAYLRRPLAGMSSAS